MYVLDVINQTSSLLSYLSGTVVIPGMSTVTVSQNYFFELSSDAQFRSDILTNKIQLSDSVNRYGNNDALKYLERIQGTKDKDGKGISSTTSSSKQGLDVNVLNSIPITDTGIVTNVYNEVTGIANGIPTTLLSYTLPFDQRLERVSVSGTNIAMYEILLDSSVISKKYTYFGGELNADFNMSALNLLSGQVLEIMVTHSRPDVGDFNSNIIFKDT